MISSVFTLGIFGLFVSKRCCLLVVVFSPFDACKHMQHMAETHKNVLYFFTFALYVHDAISIGIVD